MAYKKLYKGFIYGDNHFERPLFSTAGNSINSMIAIFFNRNLGFIVMYISDNSLCMDDNSNFQNFKRTRSN